MANTNSATVAVRQKKNKLKYGKWGIIFILPFFIAYFLFSFYPLITTFYYSFFSRFKDPVTIKTVEKFVGFQNYSNIVYQGSVRGDRIPLSLWKHIFTLDFGIYPADTAFTSVRFMVYGYPSEAEGNRYHEGRSVPSEHADGIFYRRAVQQAVCIDRTC